MRSILAPGRAERPDAFVPAVARSREDAADACPLCEGREDRTPPEVWAERPGGGEPDSPGWTARAVPNLYPLLGVASAEAATGAEREEAAPETGLASSVDPLRASTRVSEPDLFASQPADGAHEVIIHAPEHVPSMAGLGDERFAGAVAAWRERMRAHAEDAAYVHLIVNEGPDAGASLEHSHAQLYALRFVPAEVARERERASAYHERTMGGHLLSDHAPVEAVIAWQDPAIYGMGVEWASVSFDSESHAAAAEKVLADSVAQVTAAGQGGGPPVQVVPRVVQGHPAQVLLEAARGAQLLVVGSRGHGKHKRQYGNRSEAGLHRRPPVRKVHHELLGWSVLLRARARQATTGGNVNLR